jgi:hypothetical protein
MGKNKNSVSQKKQINDKAFYEESKSNDSNYAAIIIAVDYDEFLSFDFKKCKANNTVVFLIAHFYEQNFFNKIYIISSLKSK